MAGIIPDKTSVIGAAIFHAMYPPIRNLIHIKFSGKIFVTNSFIPATKGDAALVKPSQPSFILLKNPVVFSTTSVGIDVKFCVILEVWLIIVQLKLSIKH